jgi:hypothetical protein
MCQTALNELEEDKELSNTPHPLVQAFANFVITFPVNPGGWILETQRTVKFGSCGHLLDGHKTEVYS